MGAKKKVDNRKFNDSITTVKKGLSEESKIQPENLFIKNSDVLKKTAWITCIYVVSCFLMKQHPELMDGIRNLRSSVMEKICCKFIGSEEY